MKTIYKSLLRSFSAIFGVPLSFCESDADDHALTDSQRYLLRLLRDNLFPLQELCDEQKAV